MMMKKFLSILIVSVLSVVMAVAQPSGYTLQSGDAQAALTKSISSASSQLKSLKVSFTQEKSSKAFTTPAKSEGTLSYQQPDLLCWAYTSPKAYSIILNKKGACLKTAKGSTQNKMIGEMAGMILKTISGSGLTSSADFDATFYKGKDVLVMLSPKSKRVKDMYQSIEVYLNPTTYLATQVKMTDKNGDVTTIKFSNHQKNITLPAGTFNE